MRKTLVVCLVLLLGFMLAPSTFFIAPGNVYAEEGGSGGAAQLVNINTAPVETLSTLSGIGEVTAQAIIDYRNDNGPFSVIEDIKNVKGIGDVKYNIIKNLITLD